jgi:predicted nucleotidyltransferase
MKQKYSDLRVLELFFKKPTTIHFIREISREINLATTSVKKIIDNLIKQELIKPRISKPFNGYIANRDNDFFIFYKRFHNLLGLYELKDKLIEFLSPKSITLFGSYSRGEDIEESDIDILIISKIKKEINLSNLENKLKRKINIMIIDDLKKLDSIMIKKIYNGINLYGEV